jgi:tetratricopeptide (TPR) repeat protein
VSAAPTARSRAKIQSGGGPIPRDLPGAKPSNVPGRGFFLWALIFGVTLAAYWPALGAGFVWDDHGFVTPPQLRSWAGLARIWTDIRATEQYYPVLHSAFWVEHRLWGGAAVGYHLVNVLLHAASACLFALILQKLLEAERTGVKALAGATRIAIAWFGALLFALHPVCAESVAWIAEQKNTLSTVFYLLAALAYLRFERGGPGSGPRSLGGYLLATGLFTLALLSKTVTATLPAALLVALWWRRGRLGWRDVTPLIPWFALGAAGGLFSGWVERTYIGATGPDFQLTFAARCLIAGRAILFYLGKLLWPADLIFIYPRWQIDPAVGWQYLYPLGAAALIASLWLLRRRTRAPLAAVLFFAGSLFPTLGFFNVYAFLFSYVADHWQYLASLGIVALAAGGWGCWVERVGRLKTEDRSSDPPSGFGLRQFAFRTHLPAAALLVVLGVLTWRQCGMYRDVETFYETILQKNPSCWMAHNNLALYLVNQPGQRASAIAHYEEALSIKPDSAETHNNLGVALVDSGRTAEAIGQFEKAVRLRPSLAEAEDNLGSSLASSGQLEEALQILERLVRSRPDFAEAHNNLGLALAQSGRLPEAAEQCREALRIDPEFIQARRNLDVIMLALEPGQSEPNTGPGK